MGGVLPLPVPAVLFAPGRFSGGPEGGRALDPECGADTKLPFALTIGSVDAGPDANSGLECRISNSESALILRVWTTRSVLSAVTVARPRTGGSTSRDLPSAESTVILN